MFVGVKANDVVVVVRTVLIFCFCLNCFFLILLVAFCSKQKSSWVEGKKVKM